MFDFAWSEIALIAVVAVIFIGPKDMPVAIKAVTGMIRKARRMAGEFQTHVDEMMRDADLQGVRDSINEIRNFDIKGTVERAVDPDGSLRSTFASNPLMPDVATSAAEATPVTEHAPVTIERPEGVDVVATEEPAQEPEIQAPAFIPPAFVASGALAAGLDRSPPPAVAEPPAFVPPDIAASTKPGAG
jgi:sec-independent protein translocase protein TatB